MTMKINSIRINLLHYDREDRCFLPTPIFQRIDPQGQDERRLSLDEVTELGLAPTNSWMEEYKSWNTFDRNPDAFKNHPTFSTAYELGVFNDKGCALEKALRDEMTHKNVEIESFQPLYSSIEVAPCPTGWWHIKDRLYDCVVPIQQLPISDELKSRLMVWRKQKDENWLDNESIRLANEEGHDLEEHLLWELNVRYDSTTPYKLLPKRMVSLASSATDSTATRLMDPDPAR